MIAVNAIGIVRNPVTSGKDEDWGGVRSDIVVEPAFVAGLQGIEQFSHLLVVYWMHGASFSPATDLVRRPRGRDDMPELGIFAQRAKHRPNPVGVTAVRLLERRGDVLSVAGLDAIDGTPVIDLKPYFAAFDRVEAPGEPEWVARLMQGYF
jgi:tRNA-Thr(GGU) m(6)t(6)A37 methyltransferase TsaA